jgi:error-prone DNA polymerase
MTLAERLHSDVAGTTATVGPHPIALHRHVLAARGVRRAMELEHLRDGMKVRVAGAVICRQRPGTAKGFLFMTLEDETGLVNITVRPDMFAREAGVLVGHNLLEIDGVLQTEGGVSVRALEVRPAPLPPLRTMSRDFH